VFDFGQPKFDLTLKVCGLSFVFSLDLEFYNAPFVILRLCDSDFQLTADLDCRPQQRPLSRRHQPRQMAPPVLQLRRAPRPYG